MDLDECGERTTKNLRASGLFDLGKVSIHQVLFASNGKDEIPSR